MGQGLRESPEQGGDSDMTSACAFMGEGMGPANKQWLLPALLSGRKLTLQPSSGSQIIQALPYIFGAFGAAVSALELRGSESISKELRV